MRLNILAVCGFGVGSSSMLRQNVLKVLDSMGYDAKGDISDIVAGPSTPCDILFCSTTLVDRVMQKIAPDKRGIVVPIASYTDHDEIRSKLEEHFQEYPFEECKKA